MQRFQINIELSDSAFALLQNLSTADLWEDGVWELLCELEENGLIEHSESHEVERSGWYITKLGRSLLTHKIQHNAN